MHLYVPKTLDLTMDAKEDEHIMDLADWQILKEVMEYLDSFEDLKKVAGRGLNKTNVKLRYNWKLKSVPNGSVGDWYISLLNTYGDYVMDVKEGKEFPAALDQELLAARMAEDMNCTAKTAKQRLLTLKTGGHIRMEYGKVQFPADNIEGYYD